MNIKLHNAFPILVLFGYSQIASAVPAKPGYVMIDTPDGQVKVRVTGDENFHQYFSEDGYPIAERNGKFYYCDIAADGALIETSFAVGSENSASNAFKRSINMDALESRLQIRAVKVMESKKLNLAKKTSSNALSVQSATLTGTPYEPGYGLFPLSKGSRFPSYGKQKGLVILVEYNDVGFNLTNPHDYFNRMLNEEGFADFGATGSASDYFRYNSMDTFQPEFDVYGPVKLSKNVSYYGANDPWGNDMRPHQMVIEALDILDEDVDFSQYDCDGDGYIDNVFIFYAGRGEASGGGVTTVWPHANTLTNLKEPGHMYDGVTADRYACTNEWTGSRPDGVGTFIHEFSHVMGLPDLYPTSYASSFTPDGWSTMDHGSYNNDGMTPPLYSAFERYALGWIKPNEIDRAVTATLQPIGNNMAGIVRTDRDTEYFLFENRQQNGWDAYLPGHGMLVWHIDYNENIWYNNTVNNTPSHQYVDLIEADNIRTEDTRAGDSFPGESNVTSFTSTTTPSMTTWGGVDLEFPITGIKETPDGLVSFNVLGGAPADLPKIGGIELDNITATGFTATWDAKEGLDHLVSVYTKNDADSETLNFVGKYRYFNAGTSGRLEVTDLMPLETYYLTVTASNGWEMGDPSDEKTVKTDRMNLSYYKVETDEPIDVTSDGFTARWFDLEGAVGYEVALFVQEEDAPNIETCDFSNGVSNLPEGWSSSSTASYGMSSYCGEATPSLRLGKDKDLLQSPEKEDGISAIKFWHRGNGVKNEASLSIQAKQDGEDIEFETIPVVTQAGGATTELKLPSGISQISIIFNNPDGSGSVAIDDVAICFGMNYSYMPYSGYERTDVVDATEYIYTGLPSETVFAFEVTAYDDSFRSIPSERRLVTTGRFSAVNEVEKEKESFMIEDGIIILDGKNEAFLYDISGRLVGIGRNKITIPSTGVYILRFSQSGRTEKIHLK